MRREAVDGGHVTGDGKWETREESFLKIPDTGVYLFFVFLSMMRERES